MSAIFVSVSPSYVEVVGGQSVRLMLSVANTSSLIDAYQVTVFGIDAESITMVPDRLTLFPADIGQIDIELSVPRDYSAGLRQVVLHVHSENTPEDFALATVSVLIAEQPLVTMTVDPVSITGGSTAQFGLVVVNRGNAPVGVVTDGVDPEETSDFKFEPSEARLLPGEQHVVQATVVAKRPWVGAPKVRVLTFRATAVGRAEAMATFVQKPRLGRWLLSLLGLITAAAVFAAVLSRTLDTVVNEASLPDAVVNEALGNGGAVGQTVSLHPATIGGKLLSSNSGKGIAAVQAELYTSTNGTTPIASSATSDDGSFAFGRLSAGTYRLRFSGAGFADLWYDGGRVFAEGKDIKLAEGQQLQLDPALIGGRPSVVSGKVIADDTSGTKVTLLRAGVADPAVPAVVATVDVSADGSFSLTNLPSPASYQLVVERPGSATETRTVDLAPGQVLDGLQIQLRPGDGLISGHVQLGGVGVGGITISATDGTTTVSTVSLTVGDVGFYALRNLATPAIYTVTVTGAGYQPQTRTFTLAQGGAPTADFGLVPADGSIAGTVRAANGSGLGGATVSITGGTIEQSTVTVSQGGTVGSYQFDRLPSPGSYTLTFSAPGLISQVRLVEIGAGGGPATVTGIDMTLSSAQGIVGGTVYDATGAKVPMSQLTLTNGASTRQLLSAHEPIGQFAFSGVAPGTYTLTATLQGAAPVVRLLDVQAGQVLDIRLDLGQQASLVGHAVLSDLTSPAAGYNVRLFAPADFSAGAPIAQTTTAADGSYSFKGVAAPANYIVALYNTANDVAASPLDVELIASVPGQAVTVGNLVGN